MCLLCRGRQRYNTLLNKLNIKRDKIVGIQTALTIHTASATPDSRLPSQTQTRCRQTGQDRWHSDGADDTRPVRRRTHGYLPRRRPVVVKQDKIVGIQTALTIHTQCDAGLTVTFPDADPLSAFRRRWRRRTPTRTTGSTSRSCDTTLRCELCFSGGYRILRPWGCGDKSGISDFKGKTRQGVCRTQSPKSWWCSTNYTRVMSSER